MRIAHVVRQFPPSIGGLEEAVLKLGTTLQARGHDIRIVTLDRIAKGGPERLPSRDRIDGLDIRRIPFRGSWRYPLAPGVLREIADQDLVHVHGIDFFFDFLAATRFRHGKAMVASTHGGFFHTAFARHAKRLYFNTVTRGAARAYGAICASSESDLALFRPIAGDKLVLAPNGVDVAKWAGCSSPSLTRTLAYVGRFSSNKNLAALMPVLRLLRVLHPSWSLIIAGKPWDVSVAQLRAAAAQHNVGNAVSILDGPSEAAIGSALGQASYIVSASRHEGFGISVVEGLSAGLIPVLSPIAPFRTLLRDAGLGLMVDFANSDEAAEAIETHHRAAAADATALRQAAMRASQHHSWSAGADAIEHAYGAALAVRQSPLGLPAGFAS